MLRIVDPDARESEDCLRLNVWSPNADDHNRPVLVWFHPSGHMLGSGSSPYGNPRVYAAQHDCVIVTANYRLGIWGHLYLGGFDSQYADTGNQIVRDQLLLLEWIQDNIKRFGGDPTNVTVFGESGGGYNIGTLLGIPSSRGLLHKAAIYSGGATHPVDPETATELTRRLLDVLGPSVTVDDLLTMSNVRLRYAHKKLGETEAVRYSAVIDGDLIPQPPLEAIAAGAARDIPLLVSNTADEAAMWNVLKEGGASDAVATQSATSTEFAALAETYRRQTAPGRDPDVDLLSDVTFFADSAKLLAAHEEGGGLAWFEMFDYTAESFPLQDVGAMHGTDIGMLLHDRDHIEPDAAATPTENDRRVAALEQQALVSLARTGKPDMDGIALWRPHRQEDRQMVRLGSQPATDIWQPRPAVTLAVQTG
ncbi:putative carboxylesterase [Gordonia effusa NBRC 100432]|uniref:Carboxylic ester hydrolase n=2 Tax=Gordonia effusa TaxID=263908 RepID=H0R429_9ACTN|nr:putative carboxylesterase [Gordonia effusa NBRC 100432]